MASTTKKSRQEPKMGRSPMLKRAMNTGICVRPRDDCSGFVMCFKGEYFCVHQSASALHKLLDFLEEYGGVDPKQFWALTRDLNNLGGIQRIYWILDSEKNPKLKYKSMDIWLAEEHARSLPKPIVRGPFKGGQLFQTVGGFQKIMDANGKWVYSRVPKIFVFWMVN